MPRILIQTDKTKKGRTPLSWTAKYGQTEVVKALSSDGRVDPDRRDNYGRTPLSWAAGKMPLSWPARSGQTEAVKALLSGGRVDPDRRCSWPWTLLVNGAPI